MVPNVSERTEPGDDATFRLWFVRRHISKMGKTLKQSLNLLEKMGRKALQPYMKRDYRGMFRYYPAAIPRAMASIIRNHYLTHGQYCFPCVRVSGMKDGC